MFTNKPFSFGIGRTRQDHIGAVRTAIPVAALVDNEGTISDFDLVCAKVEDHVSLGHRVPSRHHSPHPHQAHQRGPRLCAEP